VVCGGLHVYAGDTQFRDSRPTVRPSQGENLALPKPWIALREGMNAHDQRLPFRVPWLPAFGPAVHAQHPPGAPFTRLVRLLQIGCHTTPSSEAYHFFPSTSFSIRLSSVRSPTSRFNSAFSRATARKRWLTKSERANSRRPSTCWIVLPGKPEQMIICGVDT
jgi:hypothetical protein